MDMIWSLTKARTTELLPKFEQDYIVHDLITDTGETQKKVKQNIQEETNTPYHGSV